MPYFDNFLSLLSAYSLQSDGVPKTNDDKTSLPKRPPPPRPAPARPKVANTAPPQVKKVEEILIASAPAQDGPSAIPGSLKDFDPLEKETSKRSPKPCRPTPPKRPAPPKRPVDGPKARSSARPPQEGVKAKPNVEVIHVPTKKGNQV